VFLHAAHANVTGARPRTPATDEVLASGAAMILAVMTRCPNSGQLARAHATNTRRINIEPYDALCPVCEQVVTVTVTHEGAFDGRTERWSEHTVETNDTSLGGDA
jgi:hypothetical protein